MISLEAILPSKSKFYDGAALTKALLNALDNVADTAKGDFAATTRTWSDQPDFYTVAAHSAGGAIVASVGTDDPIYGYVTRGTKRHLIRPKNGKFLSWEGGKYMSKTTPGTLGSRSTGLVPTGGVGAAIFAKVVNHPGTKPRAFEEAVAKRRQQTLAAAVQNALAAATRGG